MSQEPIHDPEAIARYREQLAEHIDDENVTPVCPCRAPVPCTVPVAPMFHGQAFKAGCEDEYLNRMRARYGEGWD